jgi:hypothetical protein
MKQKGVESDGWIEGKRHYGDDEEREKIREQITLSFVIPIPMFSENNYSTKAEFLMS